MDYPTLDEVEAADVVQLGKWSRFLPSPGTNWIHDPDFESKLEKEITLLNRILDRFSELGGWTPAVSKKVTWDEPTS